MSSAYTIVKQLLDTRQETAVGIGHFLKALLDFAYPSRRTPITVEYTDKEGTTKVMVFSRKALSTSFDVGSVTNIFKYDFGLVNRGDYHMLLRTNVTVTGVLLYNEDGTVQTAPVLVSEESWPHLVEHVHKIFIHTPSD